MWGLREAEIITLTPYEGKKLMVKTHARLARHLVGPPQPYNGTENMIPVLLVRVGNLAPTVVVSCEALYLFEPEELLAGMRQLQAGL